MDSFILYHSHVMTLSLLSGDECQKALLALDQYASTGEKPELKGKAAIAFDAISTSPQNIFDVSGA
jgi:hypothetical protein